MIANLNVYVVAKEEKRGHWCQSTRNAGAFRCPISRDDAYLPV